MDNQVKNLLQIIRISPVIIVLLMSVLVISILLKSNKIEIQSQKNNIEKQFIKSEKERIKSNITTIYTYAKLLQNSAEEELKKDLKNKIYNIHRIMTSIYSKNKDTKSKNEIIKQIKEAVDTIRFNNGNGYFSIHTLDGINILQPINRSYEGTSVLQRRDVKGTYTVQKAISIAKTKGEGFFNWYSLKPNGGVEEFEKIGIVKKFEPYGLIITTGVFKKDFQTVLKNKILNFISKSKYKNDGYAFVIGYEGNILYHPSQEVINSNIFYEKRFSHINNKYKNLILKKGRDIGVYLSIKPKVLEGNNTKDIRITYAKRIDDWEWIISTSFKLSDANTIIENMKTVEDEQYDRYKKDIIFYGLSFTILLLILSYFISKLLENEFVKYKRSLEKQILENKEQNCQLNTLKAQLDNAVSIATLGIWEWDIKNSVITWSDITYDIFGVNKNIPLNIKYIETLFIEEDVLLHRKKIIKCFHDKCSFTSEYSIKKNHQLKVLLVICNPIVKNDEVIKLTYVVQDITEIKEKEKDMQYAQEISQIGHYEYNIKNDFFTNSVVLDNVMGMTKNQIKNFETWIEFIFDEDKEMMQNYFASVVKNKATFDKEYRIVNQITKEIKWVHGLGVIIYDENHIPFRMFGTIQDITKIKELELDKIEKDKLIFQQSKLVAMGEMIGNIAHQWRQPLSVISTGATGMQMQKEYGVLSDESFEKTCNEINNNAQYLSKTIDDFRNFIKGDRTKVNFNLSDDIKSFLELVKGAIKNNNINLVLDIKEEITINGYPNELIQCFINIFNNSKDALNENNIEDEFIFISTFVEKKEVIIKIKDNAGGISQKALPRIFEPYFTTKHQSKGTGLGLSMTYNLIVDGMGGSIEVNNISYKYKGIDYKGAEFVISLPIN